MAHHKSAEKSIRQTKTRTAMNRSTISSMRTAVKKLEVAITSGDKAAAQATFKEVQPVIMSTVSKGLVHSNTAARKISRLSAKVKAL
jgi:small subunit ribosomal protein S20